ncbi:RidA family protein [Mesorhizobium sp. M1066]|uniref:RidA family protein n=1 Tax=unclassified Mesorhizobium TaxID=325217 RepID=UPI0033372B83
MRKVIKTHLPNESAPIEWAAMGGDYLYTAHVPIREDGTFESGDITAQTTLTMENLKRTVEAAGGTLDDVTQVLIYLPSKEDFQGMNAVYRTYFNKPYPNRATVVAGLMIEGAKIEIVAHAHITKS